MNSTFAPELPIDEPFRIGFDPLRPLGEAERAHRLEDYLRFLKARDGSADIPARKLSEREAFFQKLDADPVRWTGPVDRYAFYTNLDSSLKENLDLQTVWLLAAAKSNRVEHHGVELDLRLKGHEFASWKHGEHMTFIDLEEFYHTRILADCCAVFGLDYPMIAPSSFTRYFAEIVVRSPPAGRLVTALCGELFGCVAFHVLWETADLFAAEPEVLARLRLLVRQILIDEMGHVSYGHAMLGPRGIAAVRTILPVVSRYLLKDLPEFAILAGGRRKFLDRVAAFDLGTSTELWGRPRSVAAA